MDLHVKKTAIQLIKDNDEIYLHKGLLIEDDGLCAIYAGGSFDFVSTTRCELDRILSTQDLKIKELEDDERLCSQCNIPMLEGFYFESDGTQYCCEECLAKVISWQEYLKIHDNGNGDAFWTDWYDC
jgi:hypothetical protein